MALNHLEDQRLRQLRGLLAARTQMTPNGPQPRKGFKANVAALSKAIANLERLAAIPTRESDAPVDREPPPGDAPAEQAGLRAGD